MDYYLSNMKIMKIRDNLYKLNLLDYGTYKKIIFTLNNTITPFGIETFAKKDIINIEFTNYKNDNNMYNIYTEIDQFEKFISNVSHKKFKYGMPVIFANQIKDKKFVSCLKTSPNTNFDPLLRVHIKKQGSNIKSIFYKNIDNVKTFVNPFSIQNLKCRFSICAENIWFTEDSYGILFILNLCEVL